MSVQSQHQLLILVVEKDRTKSAHLKWPRGWSDGGRRLAAPDAALRYFHLTETRRDAFTTYAAMRSHDGSWNHMATRRWLMFPSRASRGSFGVLFLADLQLSNTVPLCFFNDRLCLAPCSVISFGYGCYFYCYFHIFISLNLFISCIEVMKKMDFLW